MGKLSGWCGEVVLSKGVGRLSGGYGEAVWRVWEGCLQDEGKLSGG